MKRAELIIKSFEKQKGLPATLRVAMQAGQSVLEILLSAGLFVLAISGAAALIIDAEVANRSAQERTLAVFLAEEGIEAARSIRDNDWLSLTESAEGHGIAVAGGSWTFDDSAPSKDVSSYLRAGQRKVIVEAIDAGRKKGLCEVDWEISPARTQTIALATYLTNWSAQGGPFLRSPERWRTQTRTCGPSWPGRSASSARPQRKACWH